MAGFVKLLNVGSRGFTMNDLAKQISVLALLAWPLVAG